MHRLKLKEVIEYCCLIVILAVVPLICSLTHGSSLDNYEKFGTYAGGVAAVIGVPLLIWNLIEQRFSTEKSEQEFLISRKESEFRLRCEGIDASFAYVTNTLATISGPSAILTYGDQCSKGIMTYSKAVSNLDVIALKAVLASMQELVEWMMGSKENLSYHSVFRARYIAVLIGFGKFLPPADLQASKSGLFKTYGSNYDEYSLAVAIWELHHKEFDLWTTIETTKSTV